MAKHYAYQHRPLSNILAPEVGEEEAKSPTPDRDEKGRFRADEKPDNKDEELLPEKYRGKTPAQIAEMHMNAEQRLGQIQNELGQMRGLVTDLAQVKRPADPKPQDEDVVDVTGDDLIRNPVEAIRKVVQRDLQEIKSERDKELFQKRLEAETDALMRDFGDIETITSSPDFQSFATRTPSRQADLETAANGEGFEQVQAARRLLENWKDFQESLAPSDDQEQQKTAVQQAREVANEGSGPSGRVTGKDLLYEADVIALLQRDPAKYRSPSFQAELMAAIKEGRFVKA